MRDRIPTKPNRYAVYDDAHNFLRYEYHERADEPTQSGDALNKANLLPDTVATALGLTGNPQVKDALARLSTLVDGIPKVQAGSYVGTGTYGAANKNTLTFSFQPNIVVVSGGDLRESIIAGRGASISVLFPNYGDSSATASVNLTWGALSLSWHSTVNQYDQLNRSGQTFRYFAFG